MKAVSIQGDSWRGVLNDEWSLESPDWDAVSMAIERLDAKKYTIVTIQGPGEQHLAVGGGAGRYIVYATFDNWEFWNLLGQRVDGDKIILNAGGQEGDYPARQIVDLAQAQAAARAFFVGLQLDPSLRWEKQ